MKLISHRGNIVGPNPSRENSPSYIDTAISAGFEVEVDINFLDGKMYLGHDTPDYLIEDSWINNRRDKIWFHCKNLQAAQRLYEMSITYQNEYKYFCHSSDSFILTSTNHIWVHDLSLTLNKTCIIPLLSNLDVKNYNNRPVYAVCTDYITYAKDKLKN